MNSSLPPNLLKCVLYLASARDYFRHGGVKKDQVTVPALKNQKSTGNGPNK